MTSASHHGRALTERESLIQGGPIAKTHFSLLFLIAGLLLSQSVQAQIPGITVDPPPLRNARMVGDNKTAPPGRYEVFGATTDAATLYAHDGRISRL
jgi:hypothetical protein